MKIAFCAMAIGVVGSGLLLAANGLRSATSTGREKATATSVRVEADAIYAHGRMEEARGAYGKLINTYGADPDPLVQDEVSAARLRVGFIEARSGDLDQAGRLFAEAESEHRGTQIANPDFGGLQDQAAYQAAVCRAKGAGPEAVQALFLEFATAYPNSPLIHAAYKRVMRAQPGDQTLAEFQRILTAQESWARREVALCGPRALAHALVLRGGTRPDIDDLERWCATGEDGTTMQGMREGAKRCGYAAIGLRVNRKDFAELAAGTLWLEGGHYVVIEALESRRVKVFDPFGATSRWRELPGVKDTEFTADVLVLNKSEKRES